MADTYYSPSGNPEIWEIPPQGYISLEEWEAARAAEASAAEAARLVTYNSTLARAERLRKERDFRLAATDYLVLADYPLTEDARAALLNYRQALRDLPGLDGAPWDGGGEITPWPIAPEV